MFEDILTLKGPNGEVGLVVMVGDGFLRSAASCLVVMGHYAYVTRKARLGFHGVRYDQMHVLKPIIGEEAMLMAVRLDGENRRIACKMAEVVIYRVLHRVYDFQQTRKGTEGSSPKQSSNFEDDFLDYIRARLSSESHRSLIDDSRKYTKMILALKDHFQPTGFSCEPATLAVNQARMFKAIITYRLKQCLNEDWIIDETAAAELTLDYLFLQDHLFGRHFRLVQELAKIFGPHFLTQNELSRHQSISQEDTIAAAAYLEKTAGEALWRFWCFTTALCRRLLLHEITLSAADAYWLGLIDEVLDTSLTWDPIAGEERKRH
jgi:hypothetical protein